MTTSKKDAIVTIGLILLVLFFFFMMFFKADVDRECLKAGYDGSQVSIVTQPDLEYHVICIKEIKEQIR